MNNLTGKKEHSPLKMQVFTSEFKAHAIKEFNSYLNSVEYRPENAEHRQTSQAIDILEGRITMTADRACKVMFALDYVESNTLDLNGNLREHQKKTVEAWDSFGRCEDAARLGGMHYFHTRRAKRYLQLLED
jgi:hypothetical protein